MSVWIPDETMLSRAELEVQIQQIRSIYIKIEILNTDDLVIDEVSGECIGGSYNINADAPIRRTCSVKFKILDKFLPSEKSVFWINKRFRLFVGITYLKTGEIIWFKKGTYAIQDPSVNISINENSISISGLDKMALFTGDISGQLSAKYMIKASEGNSGIYVHDAIKAVVKDGGESNMKISETSLIIPYKIEKNIGETRYEIINELVNLFYNYQAFYDLDGNFIFTEKPTELGAVKNSEVQWDFSSYNLIQSLERQIQYKNIKNKFTVYGGVMSKGCQASYQILLTEIRRNSRPNPPTTIKTSLLSYVLGESITISWNEAKDIDNNITAYSLESRNSADGSNWGEWTSLTEKTNKLSYKFTPSASFLQNQSFVQFRVYSEDLLGAISSKAIVSEAVQRDDNTGVRFGIGGKYKKAYLYVGSSGKWQEYDVCAGIYGKWSKI